MSRPKKPIKETFAWTIYEELKAFALAHHTYPVANTLYTTVLIPKGHNVTPGVFYHNFERLVEEGYVEVDSVTKAIRVCELKIVELYPLDVPEVEWQLNGYVYLLKSDLGFFKIGITNDLDNRFSQIQTKLPFPVERIHAIECCSPSSLERELHNRFADKRTNGEWFRLTAEDVAYIQSIKTDKEPI